MTHSCRRTLLAAAIFGPAALLAACHRDPATTVAAEVGGKPITVTQVQDYLRMNMMTAEGPEELDTKEQDRVKSRLFDDFIDEEVLYQEAQRRGIAVTNVELTEYLGTSPAADQKGAELARRDMMIQKLREAVVLAEVKVDDKEIDAWLKAHAGDAAPPLHGTLRVLRFASYPEAQRVRGELTSKKLTFEKAERTYGSEGVPGAAREVDLNALPERLAAAVKGLAPGQVSEPVPFESSVLLLLLETIDDASVSEARGRDRAHQEISIQKAETVSGELLARLRVKTPVNVHESDLPFRYVAESKTAGSQ